MELINLILISVTLVILAVGAMSVRLLFKKDGKFSGGSCRSSPGLENRGITCGCGRQESCASDETGEKAGELKQDKEIFKYMKN